MFEILMGLYLEEFTAQAETKKANTRLYASVEVCFNMSTPCFSNICIFDHLICSAVIFFSDPVFLFIGLPVPVPQAIADPEPADLDRVQCGFVPVILSAAL